MILVVALGAALGVLLIMQAFMPRTGLITEAIRRRERPRKGAAKRSGPSTEDVWTTRIRLAGFEGSIGTRDRLFLYSTAAAVFLVLLGTVLAQSPLAGILAGMVGFAAPFMLIDRLAARTAVQMERQVPGFIDSVGSALPMEGNVSRAILKMSVVTPEPLGPEVQRSLSRIALSGETLSQAVLHAGVNAHSPSLEAFAQAVEVAEREQGVSRGEASIEKVIVAIARRLREREAKVIQRRRELTMPMGLYNLFLLITFGVVIYSVIRKSTETDLLTTTLGHVVLALAMVVIPGTYFLMRAMTSSSDITAKKKKGK